MEKNHKKSSYTITLGESKKKKNNKHNNSCSSNSSKNCDSSSDDEECKKKCKKKCKPGPPGPPGPCGAPGPLVTTIMLTREFDGLDPGFQSTYCIKDNCNNKYLTGGCYITIDCTSLDTPYFLILAITDNNLITIKNINDATATWEAGAKIALVGKRGPTGATGATLFDVDSPADVSYPYGATLINNEGLISLQLAPADNVNPGLINNTDQLISGTKYFQDVIVAANFSSDPYSSWGGFNPGSIYFNNTSNSLQLYLGNTVGSTYSGSTWATIITNKQGVTAVGSTGLSYGATFTSNGYLQFGSASSTNPGIITTSGQTFSGNKYFTGIIGVGKYSTAPSVGVAGSIYYNTTISGASGLHVSNGSSWSSVKSFVIDHPKDDEKLLVHGCLEGPEAGVYYRGKGVITNNESVTIELPDYVDKLATNLTVQLTPIYDGNIYKPQYFAGEISGNKFDVHGVNGAFYWTIYGQRLSFIVEPNKNEVEIKGDGPYKWI